MLLSGSTARLQGVAGSGSRSSGGARPFGSGAAAGRRRACRVCALQAPSNPNDFGESVKRIAKKIQGSLPVIGLLSRLASPEGGFDEIAYPEFCRSVYERASPAYFAAVKELEAQNGKPAQHRALLMVLWLARYGPGIMPAKDIVYAARRVRVSQDIEVEMERFEGVRDAARRKYNMMERPAPKLGEQLEVAVDGLATLALGLPDGKELPPEGAARLAVLVSFVFPEAGEDAVRAAIEARPQRSYA